MSSKVRLTKYEKEVFVEVAKLVLEVVLIGLVIGVALTSPYGLSKFIPKLNKLRKKHGDEAVDKSLEKIIKDRFVQITYRKGKTIIKITQKGKVRLVDYDIDAISINKHKWDGKWRIVFFDIPEKLRFARNILRSKLIEIGFVKLQKSVWVCPYKCEDEISFISSVFEVEKFVNYGELSKIDCEEYLKNKFDL
ncbi:MAG: hypothetical protein NTZ65_04500 [Candidatus Berkelbacteria bacterium]|nr:hypothetical protein [Candidatus Berkelbacteria bacterium]